MYNKDNHTTRLLLSVLILFSVLIVTHSKDVIFSDNDSLHYISNDNEYNIIVASLKGDYSIVEALLNKGTSANTTFEDGGSPLVYAAQGGHLNIVKLLIKNGADVNHKPQTGFTALINAVRSKHPDIVDYLIENGADVNLQNDAGQTALIYSAYNGDSSLCNKLINKGANLDISDESGINALIAAVVNSNHQIIEILLNKGADVNAADNAGVTPVMIAAGKNDYNSLNLLLKHGADINHLSKHKQTALVIAINNNDETMVEYLIKKGADVNQRLTLAERPLTIAYYGKKDHFLIETLENNGAKQNKIPDFRRLMLGPEFSFNLNDLMLGMSIGCKEYKYKFDLTGGFIIRPYAVRVMEHDSLNYYTQYWERRSYAYLGLYKNFDFTRNKNGLTIGLREIYTFNSYRGTDIDAGKKFVTVPEIGVYQYFRGLQINLNYQYTDFNSTGVSTSRIGISIKVIFGSGSSFALNSYSL